MRGKNSLVSLGPIAEFSPAFTAGKEFGRAVSAMVFQSKFGGPEFKSRVQVPTLSRPSPDLVPICSQNLKFFKKSPITQNIQTANCFASGQLDS